MENSKLEKFEKFKLGELAFVKGGKWIATGCSDTADEWNDETGDDSCDIYYCGDGHWVGCDTAVSPGGGSTGTTSTSNSVARL